MIGYRMIWKLYLNLELEEFASILFSNKLGFIDSSIFMLFLADNHDLLQRWITR
jgi:hypothetical protein